LKGTSHENLSDREMDISFIGSAMAGGHGRGPIAKTFHLQSFLCHGAIVVADQFPGLALGHYDKCDNGADLDIRAGHADAIAEQLHFRIPNGE
jgi:hypothetical protein